MTIITSVLPYIELFLSIILVAAILLQQTGSSVGGAFGGGDGSSSYHTRRGFEKFLFYLTIVTAILFAVSAILTIFVK